MSNPKIIQIAFKEYTMYGLSDDGEVYRQVLSRNKDGFPKLVWEKEMDGINA